MAFATCEISWFKAISRKDSTVEQQQQARLVCDNLSALYLTKNPIFHEHTKHNEVDCHFIRKKIVPSTNLK